MFQVPSRLVPAVTLVSFTCAIVGCADTYKLEQLPLPDGSPGSKMSLPSGACVSVELPDDGSYAGKRYLGSGPSVQRAVVSALRTFGVDASEAQAAAKPSQAAAPWRVTPLIIGWEDRATEWSGKPDRISIELRTSDPTGRLVDAALVSGASKWATLGGDHPEDMLRPAILPWAARFRPVQTGR